MTTPRHLARSFAALFALALFAPVAAPAAPERDAPIAAARHLPLGSTVTVRGTVTVPSDAFDPGFAVQQAGAGIYVLDSGGGVRAIGDDVRITGTLVDSFGQLAIAPSSVTALGHRDPVLPRRRATGSVGETTEGRLIELEGELVGEPIDDSPFGFKLFIDDGSGPVQLFVTPGSGISTADLHDGMSLEVVCFSTQFDTTIECNPRSPADLEIE